VRTALEFVLNGEIKRLEHVDPTLTVLRYLREVERLVGSKEGCAEGDCGACTAVLVERDGERLRYRAVNTCIQLVGTLDGKGLITIEHLKTADGLHPVQQDMIDAHASQCGFCTPGFVMSVFAGCQHGVEPTRTAIDDLLAGNLCRCTGYSAIIAAARKSLSRRTPHVFAARERRYIDLLGQLHSDDSIAVEEDGRRFLAPSTSDELAEILANERDPILVAGGTDVGLLVTKQNRRPDTIVHLGRVRELSRLARTQQGLHIGAAVTYERAWPLLAELHPDLGELIRRLGAVQVRSLGTIGGNIANGSPIGDMPPALIAANASLTLRQGRQRREIPLEEFFIAYGRQDRRPGELVEAVFVPAPRPDAVLKVYKISKRFDQDISSVCGAFNMTLQERSGATVVTDARICFGGMAGTPLRASRCEAFLRDKPWSESTVSAAQDILRGCYAPISDWRASATYRSTLAGNLLRKYFLETSGGGRLSLAARQEAVAHER
jgi:xanthine dehydrogenase small subunit